MNCQELHQILGADGIHTLPANQRAAARQHLDTCHACREDLVSWQEMVALPLPATPIGLHGRIAAALAARHAAPLRSFRPWVVGGLLLAGAAAAAAIFLQHAPPDAALTATTSPSVAAAPPPAEQIGERPTAAPPAPTAEHATAATSTGPTVDLAHTILVLKRPNAAAGPEEIALANRCHNAVVRQLHNVRELKIIADHPEAPQRAFSFAEVPPNANNPWASPTDRQIARRLQAGKVLFISTDNGCNAYLSDSQTGELVGGGMAGEANPGADDWYSFASLLAKEIAEKILHDPKTLLADQRARLLNTGLGDDERVDALWHLPSEVTKRPFRRSDHAATASGFFDREVLAAVIALGTRSRSAEVRSSTWAIVRDYRIDDPALADALVHSLAKDANDDVRMQAAFTLGYYVDKPGVRDALLKAAAEDSSATPKEVCCIYSVREAAERAAVPDNDFDNWVHKTLLNSELPVRSRLLPLVDGAMDGRFATLGNLPTGREDAAVVFDIGRREQNPKLRQMAWNALSRAAPDDKFIPVLLNDLQSHPDEYVRAAAARILTKHTANPDVQQALEQARHDMSFQVRGLVEGKVSNR